MKFNKKWAIKELGGLNFYNLKFELVFNEQIVVDDTEWESNRSYSQIYDYLHESQEDSWR